MFFYREKANLWQKSDNLEHELKKKIGERWVDDVEVTKCTECQTEFSFLVRKVSPYVLSIQFAAMQVYVFSVTSAPVHFWVIAPEISSLCKVLFPMFFPGVEKTCRDISWIVSTSLKILFGHFQHSCILQNGFLPLKDEIADFH